ncbi:MAG: hypothetical protein WCB79_06325 [Halobacteriota archaeon]
MDVGAHPDGSSNPKGRWQQPVELANKDLDQTIANYNSYSTYRMLNTSDILDKLKAGVGTAADDADTVSRSPCGCIKSLLLWASF